MRLLYKICGCALLRSMEKAPGLKFALQLAIMACVAVTPAISIAQSKFDTSDDYYEDARQRSYENDVAGAILQLKNALQLESEHAPSMLLLGELILMDGQPRQAASLLSDALLLGADPLVATPMLIEAYLQSTNYSAILSELPFETASPALMVELMAAHAQALLGLGRIYQASSLIDDALALEPDNFRLQLALVTLAIRRQQPEKALTIAQRLVDEHPTDSRAWNTLASAQQLTGRSNEAIDAYERVLSLTPGNIDTRLSLIGIFLQQNRKDAAAQQVAYLREQHPGEPRAAYFEGVLARAAGKETIAQDAFAVAANGIDTLEDDVVSANLQLLMIGALANMEMGVFKSATGYLQRYLSINPEDPGAQRLYATNLLALKEDTQALGILEKLSVKYPRNTETLSLLASAYASTGKHARAARILSSLVETGEGEENFAAQFGVSLLNAGKLRESIGLLESVVEKQQGNSSLRLPLAIAYMRDGQWARAEETLLKMLEIEPSDSNLHNLLSICLLSQGRFEDAERKMRTLIADHPEYLPAQINLAKLKIQQEDFAGARALLNAAESARPNDAQVAYELAKFSEAVGDDESALRSAERAVQLDDRKTEYAALLVRQYLAKGMNEAAETLAKKVSISSEDRFAGSLLYGRVLLYLNKTQDAATFFIQMARTSDYGTEQLLQIAQLQSQNGAHGAAINSLNTALSKQDGDTAILYLALISEYLAARRPAAADDVLQRYQQEYPQDVTGALREGDIALSLKQWPRAHQAYETAERLGAGSAAILGQFRALQAAGDASAARDLLKGHIEDTSKPDPVLLAAYSDVLMAAESWLEAESALSSVLLLQPGSWPHWNNRAIVRLELGSDGAEADARRALAIAPESPATNDTLGWILVAMNEPQQALAYLREAATRDATNPEVRYHLAVALAALGRNREAKAELQLALNNSQFQRDRANAQALLKSIGDGP